MSATLETGVLEKYLAPGCDTLLSRGRTFPVDIEYLPRPAPFDRVPAWELAAEELARLAAAHPEGDALIFMPGAYEIGRTLGEIRNHPRLGRDWIALPLHGELPPAEQDAAAGALPGQAQGRRRHQRRRNLPHHRRRAPGHRRRAGAHRPVRSVPRDQHAAR